MSRSIWAKLGVRAGSDRDTIRRAYAAKLRETNPEDNPEGFMELRAAYEAALQRAGRVVEPVADEPVRADAEDEEPLHVERATPNTLLEHAEPEPPDPELADLQARWDVLASSLENRWGADPALLRALIAAPAMERITVRAEIEGHVAALIANHIPKSDTLVIPAIRAFCWDGRGVASRSDHAVRVVLSRAAELPQNEGEVVPAPAKGLFNRFGRWSFSGFRAWFFAGLLVVNVLRLVFDWPARTGGRDPALIIEQPAEAPGALVPLKALPPDAGKWLTPADVVSDPFITAPTVKLTVGLEFDNNGAVTDCSVRNSEPISSLGGPACRLLQDRARLGPAARRDTEGKMVVMTSMWARQPSGVYAPVRLTPPPEAEPTRRAPECPREPAPVPGTDHPPSPCSPQANWLRFEDFPKAKLLAAGSRTLTARFEVGRDGYISNCRLDPPSGVAAVDAKVCRLLIRRGHYLPGRDSSGRTTRWNNGFAWGWTVSKREAPLPVPAVPKAEFKASATDAPLGGDDLPK